MLRSLGATSWREIGLVPPYGQWKKLFRRITAWIFLLAVVAGIAIGLAATACLFTIWRRTRLSGTIFSAIGTAAIVATLEEILFRGGIFGGLRRMLHWPFALLISSVIYALVHFLQRAEFTGPVAWNSGLVLLPQMLGGFADFHALVPGFFNLTLAGVLLGLAYQRTGNLYFSIGLHAGWIFWLKTYGASHSRRAACRDWFWGTGKMIDGWLAFFVLAATLAIFKFLPLDQRRATPFAIPTMTSFAAPIQNWLNTGLGFFYPGNLPALRKRTRHGPGRLCRRAMLVAGALHPAAVLRTLRPAVCGRPHDAV